MWEETDCEADGWGGESHKLINLAMICPNKNVKGNIIPKEGLGCWSKQGKLATLCESQVKESGFIRQMVKDQDGFTGDHAAA